MEYYSCIKRNKIVSFSETWIDLETLIQREVSQKEKSKYHMYACTCCHFNCVQLCDAVDYSPPGSSVHGILQLRILEWTDISYSRGSFQPRNQTRMSYVSWIGKKNLYH